MALLVLNVGLIVINVSTTINVQLALILIIGLCLHDLVDNALLHNIMIIIKHRVKIVALIALLVHQILYAPIVKWDIGLILLPARPAQEVVRLVLQKLFARHVLSDTG